MSRKNTFTRNVGGFLMRNLGWMRSSSGSSVHHKFYLGHDEAEAMPANLRLEAGRGTLGTGLGDHRNVENLSAGSVKY